KHKSYDKALRSMSCESMSRSCPSFQRDSRRCDRRSPRFPPAETALLVRGPKRPRLQRLILRCLPPASYQFVISYTGRVRSTESHDRGREVTLPELCRPSAQSCHKPKAVPP